ncbi:MAG: cytochrome c peroxidase [Myxococcota bacterium]
MRAARLISVALLLGACDRLGPKGHEWELIESLAIVEPLSPPLDRSNKHAGDARAEALGHAFYFDADFSGQSTLIDMLGRSVATPPGRAPKGERMKIACVSCHDPARGGSDHTSSAEVSIGAGAYDVNSQPTINSAFNDLWYWNGRNDSLWAQIVAVDESPVSMGGNRLRTMWRVADAYRAPFEALAGPLPVSRGIAAQKALLGPDGSCLLDAQNACPAGDCAVDTATVAGQPSCWPRFPLEGRPGSKTGCQRGDATEPFGDAFDCMAAADKDAVTGVYVAWAKMIAAYERTLVSQDSAFDRWVKERNADLLSTALSDAAERGARLFVGKAACIECHRGKLLTDFGFHDIGVPQDGAFVPTEDACTAGLARCDCTAGKSCLPWGLFDGLSKLKTNAFRRDGKWSDDPTDDSRAHWTALDLTTEAGLATKRTWKTPSLRDVALTAPYMHNGRYATLRDVLEHYNWGGHPGLGTRDPQIVPLDLSDDDLQDLEAFLTSLTGAPMPIAQVTAPELPPPSAF